MNRPWAQAWDILEDYLSMEFSSTFDRVPRRKGHRFMFSVCIIGGENETWADLWCNENAPRYGFRIYLFGSEMSIAAGNVHHIDHLNAILSGIGDRRP